MAVILILILFVVSEKKVNTGFNSSTDIYRIKRGEKDALIPETLLADVKGKVPGVDKMCLYFIREELYKFKEERAEARFIATNNDFLDIFSLEFIYQSSNPTLSADNNIILTRHFSEKLYGDKNPVGEGLEIKDELYNIVGVVNDPPKNSSFKFDVLTNLEKPVKPLVAFYNVQNIDERFKMYKSFVLLNPKANSDEINNQLSGMLSHWQLFKDDKLSIQPLKEVYFDAESRDDLDHANVDMIYLLSCIALIILFMTAFNYANLTISRGFERVSEIGIKKASGASKKYIFSQFITESLIVSFFAMILAVSLSSALSPLFSKIIGKEIGFHTVLLQPETFLVGILSLLVIGLLSGIYPALIISRVSTIQALTQKKLVKRKSYQAGIIAIQFLITIVLITSLLVVNKQLNYVKNKDLVFDQNFLIRLKLNGNSQGKWEVLKNKLLSNPSIISVAGSEGTAFDVRSNLNENFEDQNGTQEVTNLKRLYIDKDYLNTMGMELISGRNVRNSDTNVSIINERLYNHLNWESIEGKKNRGRSIIGVVKDFHYEKLYNEIGFLDLCDLSGNPTDLSIKFRGDISSNLIFIKETFNEIDPGTPLDYEFYDSWIQSVYEKEEKQAYAIKLFSVLAIIIACLGLIGLAEHSINKKIKEIGIRKVNGAKVSEILAMLNSDFVKWVTIAFAVATPIAYYAMHKWLENFAYKTTLSWWIFALAGLLALGIALLTVSWQSWRAATRNPVEALRYE